MEVEERLLARAVARDEERVPPCVPDGEGKHAAKALDAIRAELLVRVDDGLRVRVRVETMSARF